MEQLVNDWVKANTDVPNIGDTPENKGQCTGLIEEWLDYLRTLYPQAILPHIWGNAANLMANTNTNYYKVVYNDPNDTNQFPPVGAIICWNKLWGGGFGHTALVVWADGVAFKTFEQNDLTPQDPHGLPEIMVHNYNNVLGWIIPYVDIASTSPSSSVSTSLSPSSSNSNSNSASDSPSDSSSTSPSASESASLSPSASASPSDSQPQPIQPTYFQEFIKWLNIIIHQIFYK